MREHKVSLIEYWRGEAFRLMMFRQDLLGVRSLEGYTPCHRCIGHRSGRQADVFPHAAYSLVEVIAILVILGLLAAVAVPRVGQFTAQERLAAAANRIESDLKLAQRHARFGSASQTVQFNTTAHSYQLVGMTDPDRPSQAYIIRLNNPPYDALIVSVNFGGNATLVYDGYGQPNSNGSLTLAVGDYQRTLTFEGPNVQVVEPPDPIVE